MELRHSDPNSFEHLVEPPYNLERGRMLNEESAKRDPAFKKRMEDGRAEGRRSQARNWNHGGNSYQHAHGKSR
jgi:hypothetical protein